MGTRLRVIGIGPHAESLVAIPGCDAARSVCRYATIEVTCTSETGECQPSAGLVMMGPGYGDDPGSASLLDDSSPTGNTMIWDVWINGNRMDFIGPMSASS